MVWVGIVKPGAKVPSGIEADLRGGYSGFSQLRTSHDVLHRAPRSQGGMAGARRDSASYVRRGAAEVLMVFFFYFEPRHEEGLNMATTFPSGNCSTPSIWRLVETVWKPVGPTFNGNCTAALHFPECRRFSSSNPLISSPTRSFKIFFGPSLPDRSLMGWTTTTKWHSTTNSRCMQFDCYYERHLPGFSMPMVPFGTPPIDLR